MDNWTATQLLLIIGAEGKQFTAWTFFLLGTYLCHRNHGQWIEFFCPCEPLVEFRQALEVEHCKKMKLGFDIKDNCGDKHYRTFMLLF